MRSAQGSSLQIPQKIVKLGCDENALARRPGTRARRRPRHPAPERVPGSHERLKWSQPLPGANERALMSAHERSRVVPGSHERS